MPTRHPVRRLPTLLSLAALAALVLAAVAMADTFSADNDTVDPGNQATRTLSAAPGETVSTSQQLVLSYSGQNHVVAGSTVSAAVNTAQTNLPAGYSVSTASIPVPNPWLRNGEAVGTSNIQFTAPTIPDTYTYTVKWDPSGTCEEANCITGGNAMTIKLTVTSAQQPQNQAPAVSSAAADAEGTEGDTLSTSGSFTDADGDALTLSANNAVGTFTDNGNGSWSWSLPTDDDVAPGEITVTADDGNGAQATDTFTYGAVNAAPVLGSLGASGTNCNPSLAFSFTDVGSADTHEGSISWGDGSSPDLFTSSPVSQSHGYVDAGSYSIAVEVSDDDGGSDSATTTHQVYNVPSGVLQPINNTGPRSLFKLGSTVPVKITVANCAGGAVSGLAPAVKLQKLDNNPDGTSTEPTSTANPTTGTTMRWDATGQQYIYNLGTKPLTAGDWEVVISDASFSAPVKATFSLKK